MDNVERRTDLFGEEQPERIFLTTYKHSGEVRWDALPEEDDDEFQAVEYVRADLAAIPSTDDEWQGIETAPKDERIIVVTGEGKQWTAKWKLNYWCIAGTAFPLVDVTHWRPLPAPPKGGE